MEIVLELLLTFVKIGLFTFGGGYAMLPMIRQEVLAHGWMTLEEIVNFIAVSESTPGVFAVNISTYVGAETAGLPGALCCTFGVTLPSFIIISILAGGYEAFQESTIVKGIMSGLRPAVVGLIGAALFSVVKTVFLPNGLEINPGQFGVSLLVVVLSLLIRFKKKVHPIVVILLAAAIGIAAGYLGLLG